MDKIISIQLLRGIASILVLILHAVHKEHTYGAGYFSTFNIGHIGVDIFFIISGFVMLYTFKPKMDAQHFLVKRAIRILPIYWATLSLVIVAYFIQPNLVNGGRESSILGSLFLIPTDALFLNQNAWTLTYEFIFYIIFSSVFFLDNQYKILFVTSVILVFSFIGEIASFSNPLLKVLTSSLLIEFTFGFILYFYYKCSSNKIKFSFLCFLIMAAFLIIYFELLSEHRFISLGIPALGLCCFFVYFEDLISTKITSIANFLGDISYSLYLIHPFTLASTSIMLNLFNVSNPYVFMFSMLSTSILFGWLTFKYLECPLTHKLKSNYKRYCKA